MGTSFHSKGEILDLEIFPDTMTGPLSESLSFLRKYTHGQACHCVCGVYVFLGLDSITFLKLRSMN